MHAGGWPGAFGGAGFVTQMHQEPGLANSVCALLMVAVMVFWLSNWEETCTGAPFCVQTVSGNDGPEPNDGATVSQPI